MVEFKRKNGERFESFLRRFNTGLKRSGKLYEARSRQYHNSDKNKRQQKEYALVSLELKSKREYLRKTGKLSDEIRR